MGLLDSFSSVLDSGAVESAIDIGSSAASSGGWWESTLDFGTRAFEWMEKYPETANVLGGVAVGAGTYLGDRALQDKKEEIDRKQWERERAAKMISPGKVNNYGSYGGQYSGGLITGGQIAGYRSLADRKKV